MEISYENVNFQILNMADGRKVDHALTYSVNENILQRALDNEIVQVFSKERG